MNKNSLYFGSANGYTGFRSNFDSIFSPGALTRLFIIKGGPGTGKSTLMKRLGEEMENDAMVTSILCSSDSKSLDGVIIENGTERVGIVDGTAPHVVEAKYPGAVEEIINLCDGLDSVKLRARKEEIISLCDRKRRGYDGAYGYLKNAGMIKDYIHDNFVNDDIYNAAEMLIVSEAPTSDIARNNCVISPNLIGSFSKDGCVRLQNISSGKRVIKVEGDGISEYLLMSEILRGLRDKSIACTVVSSPFSPEMPDEILTESVIYRISDNKDFGFDSSVLFADSIEYFELKARYDSALKSAAEALSAASEFHFRLEEIYTDAVDFDYNDKKYAYILDILRQLFNK